MGITLYIFVLLAAKSLQSCLTLSDPMDCSLPGSSIHGIFQARVLEWGAIAFSPERQKQVIKQHVRPSMLFPKYKGALRKPHPAKH